MRTITHTETVYDAIELEALDLMDNETIAEVLEGIERGWLPQDYIVRVEDGKEYSEDKYWSTRQHIAIQKAIKLIRGLKE